MGGVQIVRRQSRVVLAFNCLPLNLSSSALSAAAERATGSCCSRSANEFGYIPPVLTTIHASNNMITVHYFYDEQEKRLVSSNVPYFPSRGAPYRRDKMSGSLHLPQYQRAGDPARPFYHTDLNLLRASDLLQTLAYERSQDIAVFQYNDGFWFPQHVKHWVSLESFFSACSNALGYDLPSTPETLESRIHPYWQGAETPREAQERAFLGRKTLNWYLALLSYLIFKHRGAPQTWVEKLQANDHVMQLHVHTVDGRDITAAVAIEEIMQTFVAKFGGFSRPTRVGVFVDVSSDVHKQHTMECLAASIPVWFDWGKDFRNTEVSALPTAWGGLPPSHFIPPHNAIALAKRVAMYPWSGLSK
jgi:hypothetical protein